MSAGDASPGGTQAAQPGAGQPSLSAHLAWLQALREPEQIQARGDGGRSRRPLAWCPTSGRVG